MKLLLTLRWAVLCVSAALFAACGGSDGDTNIGTSSSSSSLSGTVATGAPMKSAEVTIKDRNGKSTTAKTGDAGKYTADITGMTPPLIAKAVGKVKGADKTYYALLQSLASSGVLNISPVTDAMAQTQPDGKKPNQLFDSPTNMQQMTEVDFEKLVKAQQQLAKALKNFYAAMGVDTSFDVTSSPFDADHEGMDALLDCLEYDDSTKKLSVKSSCNNGAEQDAFDPGSFDPNADLDGLTELPAPPAGLQDFISESVKAVDTLMAALNLATNGEGGGIAVSTAFNAALASDYLEDDGDTNTSRSGFISDWVDSYNNGLRLEIVLNYVAGFVNDETAADDDTLDMCATAIRTENGGTPGFSPMGISFKKQSGAWKIATPSASVQAASACGKGFDIDE